MVRRPLRFHWRIGWIDSLVVCAVSLTFAAVAFSHNAGQSGRPSEQTIQAMASELGVAPQDLRRATDEMPPPQARSAASEANRAEHHRVIAATLGVPVARFEAVLEKYVPRPRL
jgi:hypothetical protein